MRKIPRSLYVYLIIFVVAISNIFINFLIEMKETGNVTYERIHMILVLVSTFLYVFKKEFISICLLIISIVGYIIILILKKDFQIDFPLIMSLLFLIYVLGMILVQNRNKGNPE